MNKLQQAQIESGTADLQEQENKLNEQQQVQEEIENLRGKITTAQEQIEDTRDVINQ